MRELELEEILKDFMAKAKKKKKVVNCGECVFRKTTFFANLYCSKYDQEVKAKNYCAWGERSDD